MLITIRKRFMSTGGQLHIALPDPNIRTSFELANMQRLLHLFASVDEAMAAFKA
jgi:anti-anti-sigma regulatory factor